jgi:hypothetical protein
VEHENNPGPGTLDRRVFLRRMAIGAAVAVPVVTTFSLAGAVPAAAQVPNVSGPVPTTPATTPAVTTTPAATTTPAPTTTPGPPA